MQTKVCPQCKIEKSVDGFGKNKSKSDGLQNYCKECRKQQYSKNKKDILIKAKKRYSNKREDILIKVKEYREANKEKISENYKVYYLKNRQQILNRVKKYAENNKEKIALYNKKWLQLNKDYINKYAKKKRDTDLNYKLKGILRGRLYKVVKGVNKSKPTLGLLGCSIEYLREHLEKQFVDGMSWSNYGNWHIDHIKPCASFDLTDPEQQKICFHYTNLQPLWAKDNLTKSNKLIYNNKL